MKIHKPSYDATARLYTCQLTNGFRLQTTKEDGATTNLYKEEEIMAAAIPPIIEGTTGWFTKPLTADWLKGRIRLSIPTGDVPSEFEGTIDYDATSLVISKEEFTIVFKVAQMKQAEKVVIQFQEEELPAKRTLQKSDVLKARARAAKALFMAERLTQEYIRIRGGEDTDWEDEEDEEGDF